MRCLNCQCIWYTKKSCQRSEPTCCQCSEEGSVSKQRRKIPAIYINCGKELNSLNKTRPYYQFTVAKEKLTIREAEDMVIHLQKKKTKQLQSKTQLPKRKQPNRTTNKSSYLNRCSTSKAPNRRISARWTRFDPS